MLFVAEDRDLLHTATVDTAARDLYADYFSTARLRTMAATHAGGRHTDLWEAHQIVTDALAGDGLPTLGLSGLGATPVQPRRAGHPRRRAAPQPAPSSPPIRALSQIDDPITGTPRPVDYRNLDSEELGGIYEGLLAYTPRYDADARTFTLDIAAGNDRKKSGSYYTPSELIDARPGRGARPAHRRGAAHARPGAGAARAHRRRPRLRQRAFPGRRRPPDRRGAGHRPHRRHRAQPRRRCAPPPPTSSNAASTASTSTIWPSRSPRSRSGWKPSTPARPFPFLDPHFRVGNALLGTTPALLRDNIPDAAFAVLGDDDKDWTAKLKARNKAEREANADQLDIRLRTRDPRRRDHPIQQGRARRRRRHRGHPRPHAGPRRRLARLEADPDLVAAKLVADAWCAAFVQPKTNAPGPLPTSGQGITHATLRDLSENPDSVPHTVVALIDDLARQYRFFHWHLEFPGIFTVPDDGSADPATGWSGGFSCVVGNPPWETRQAPGQGVLRQRRPRRHRRRRHRRDPQEDDRRPGRHRPRSATGQYRDALRQSDATAHLLLKSGRYPLTGTGRRQHLQRVRRDHAHDRRPERVPRDHHPDRARHRQDHRPVLRRHPAQQAPPCVLRLRERSQDLPGCRTTKFGSRSRP